MTRSIIVCLTLLCSILFVTNLDARTKLTQDEAEKLLLSRIQKEKLYGEETSAACLTVFSEESGSDHFDFTVHVNRGGRCPGNPNAPATADHFRVNRLTKAIEMNGDTGKTILKHPSKHKTGK